MYMRGKMMSMQPISARLDELYASLGRKDFIPCGLVDEDSYSASAPKVLFLLKEVNSKNLDWNVPGHVQRQISTGKIRLTWKRMGMWSYAIHNNFPEYESLVKDKEAIKVGLKSIAITNVKKSRGQNVSKYYEIRKHAWMDKDLWQTELQIMDPDIVICGGTYSIITKILGLERHFICRTNNSKRSFYYSTWTLNNHQVLIFNFYHPAVRKSHIPYQDLRAIVSELVKRNILILTDFGNRA
jgi:hypothetical protein